MNKIIYLLHGLVLLSFFSFGQQLTSIVPNQGNQGQSVPLIISGNNMSFSGWSCWSNTGNLSDFRFSQWSGSGFLYGISSSSTNQSLTGQVNIPNFQPTGIYNLEVLDCYSNQWVALPNSFQINPIINPNPSWDCITINQASACIDPGTGNGQYSNLNTCLAFCNITPSWDCDGLGNCYDPGTGNGQYSSLVFCQAVCSPPPTWVCNPLSGNCYDPGDGSGYTDYNLCIDSCFVQLNIDENINKLEIFPNPTNDFINLDISINSLEDINISLIDILGKEIFNKMYLNTNLINDRIDISNQKDGLYFIEIKYESSILKRKILIN